MRKRKGLPWALSGWIHSVSALYSRLGVVRQTLLPVSFASLCCVLCSEVSLVTLTRRPAETALHRGRGDSADCRLATLA